MNRHGVVVTREGILQLVEESDVQVDLVIETETKEDAEKLRLIFGTLHREGVYKGMYLSSYIRNEDYSYGLIRLQTAMRTTYEEIKQKREGYKVHVTKENAEQVLRYIQQSGSAMKITPYKFICAFLESVIGSFNAKVDPPPSHPSVRE